MSLKRAFDISSSAIGMAVLSPVVATLSVISLFHFRANPFYPVDRLGKDTKVFSMIKLRSMNNARDEKGNLLPDNDRTTGFGKFLRATALDEIPQLINIFKGDMSFVGPRPLSPKQRHQTPESHSDIFSVRPGLTGPWQIAAIGRADPMPQQERLDLDQSYVQNPTLAHDVLLILKSFPAFIKGHDGESLKK